MMFVLSMMCVLSMMFVLSARSRTASGPSVSSCPWGRPRTVSEGPSLGRHRPRCNSGSPRAPDTLAQARKVTGIGSERLHRPRRSRRHRGSPGSRAQRAVSTPARRKSRRGMGRIEKMSQGPIFRTGVCGAPDIIETRSDISVRVSAVKPPNLVVAMGTKVFVGAQEATCRAAR